MQNINRIHCITYVENISIRKNIFFNPELSLYIINMCKKFEIRSLDLSKFHPQLRKIF